MSVRLRRRAFSRRVILTKRALPYAAPLRIAAQSGAHDRNRTDDLLLTMEMLYRLSYVGFADRDVQVGSTARNPRQWLEYCTGS